MTKQTTDERIVTRRAALTTQRAERLDPLDYPRVWTQRQVNEYLADTARIDGKIATFESAVGTWAALPPLEPDAKWRDFLHTARATIDAELLTLPPRIRNEKELERQQWLKFSLELIDHGFAANRLPAPIVDLSSTRIGELMEQAGYATRGLEELRGPRGFRGSLPDTEQRVRDLTSQRAAAEAAEAALASVLMTDAERAQREAESAELRAAFNAMRVKVSPDGTGYIVVDEDGAPRDLATLTPIERQAFERQDTAYRQEQQARLDRQLGQR